MGIITHRISTDGLTLTSVGFIGDKEVTLSVSWADEETAEVSYATAMTMNETRFETLSNQPLVNSSVVVKNVGKLGRYKLQGGRNRGETHEDVSFVFGRSRLLVPFKDGHVQWGKIKRERQVSDRFVIGGNSKSNSYLFSVVKG